MRLIVEGPDLVGKSSLLQRLGLRSGLPIYRWPHNAEGVVEGSREQLMRMLKVPPENALVDRWWPSEMIYAEVMQRPCKISVDDIEAFIRHTRTPGIGIYVCLFDTLDAVRERVETTGAFAPERIEQECRSLNICEDALVGMLWRINEAYRQAMACLPDVLQPVSRIYARCSDFAVSARRA